MNNQGYHPFPTTIVLNEIRIQQDKVFSKFQQSVYTTGTSLMHLGISVTPTSIGTFKWRCLRMKLASSLKSMKKDFSTT